MDELPEGKLPDELTLAPLSHERIEREFAEHDIKYWRMSDGDFAGNWDHNTFYFFVAGEDHEILTIRGDWSQRMPIELRAELLLALDEWHRDTRWPKGYTHVDDEGRLWISAELSMDWENGLTDGQLHQMVVCAISTSLSLFEYLAERFPVTVTPRRDD
jgi:hypothetical protein